MRTWATSRRISLQTLNYIIAIVVIALGIVATSMAYKAMNRHSAVQVKPKQATTGTKIGVWLHSCNEGCRVTQKIKSSETNADIVEIRLSLTNRIGQTMPVPRLKIIAPLGTFLPTGISIALAGQEPLIAPFQSCTKEGCIINLDLADDIVTSLKQSETLGISYHDTNITVPLEGFAQSLEQIFRDYSI